MKKRILSILLLCCMVLTMLPAPAFAAEGETGARASNPGGLCEHHPAHDEACGYTEGTAEIPCSHEHAEECHSLITRCVHAHTAECYPAESVSENADGLSEAENAAPTECAHGCTEKSGCILQASDCKHAHGKDCGYAPAAMGKPCTYVCEICDSKDGKTTMPLLGAARPAATQYTYTLHYDANGGSGAPPSQSMTSSEYQVSFLISDKIPTRDGYTFKGWADSPYGEPKYLRADGYHWYCNVVNGQTNSTTIYAIWEVHNHSWGEWTSNGNGTHKRTCITDSSHTETGNCSGGKATGTEKAICETCHTAYGELLPLTKTVITTPPTLPSEGYVGDEYLDGDLEGGEAKVEGTDIVVPGSFRFKHKWGGIVYPGENRMEILFTPDDAETYATAECIVTVTGIKHTITSVTEEVLPDEPLGTAFEDLWRLPPDVEVKTNTGRTFFPIPVTWDSSSYDPNARGEQIITGQLHVEESRFEKKLEPTSIKAIARITLIGDEPIVPTLEPPTYSRQIYSGDFCQLAFSDEYLSGGKATADGETVDGVFTLNEEQEKYGYWRRDGGLVQVGSLALKVTFTPDDLLKYTTAECTVNVDVIPRKFRQANTSYIDNKKIGTAFEDLDLPNAFYFFAEADEPNHEGSGLNGNVPGIIEWDNSNYDPNSYEEQTIYGEVNRAEFEKDYIVPEGADLRGVVKVTLQADPVETEITQPPVFRWEKGDFALPDNTMFVNRIFGMGSTGGESANLADGVAKVKGTDTVVPGTFSFKEGTPGWFDELGENVVTVVFTPTDQHGYRTAETTIKVNVIKNTLKRCEEPDPITEKKLGTTFAGLNLPEIVVVEAIDGLRVGMEVSWEESSYDAQSTAWQTIPGTLVFDANDEHRYQQPEPAVTAAIRVKLIGPEDAPAITTTTLPGGTVGTPYHHQLQATGGGFILWELFSGELPDGLTLKQTTGEISGTPTAEQTAQFTVRALNSVGNDKKELSITITNAPAAEHAVTVITDGNGTASASSTSATAGTEITLTATPNTGYHFKEWKVESPTGLVITNNKFLMPDSNVEVKAIFEEDAPPVPTEFTITVKTEGNGTASASPDKAVAGTEIRLTATPNTGYHFKEWQVMSGGVTIMDDKFTMPSANVEVKAIFEKDAPPAPTEFIVTFDGNGGTPSVVSMTTTNQKLTSLPSASRSGSYSFDGWYTDKSGGTKITTDTVFSANTTVYAHWTYIGGGGGYNPPVTYYTLRFETGGGSDIPSVREAYNAYIDLSQYVPTWRGHTFIGWYSERSLTNKVSGVYLTKDMTVYAGWRVDENPNTGANPFTDVSEKDWFYSDVMFVYENGLMLGTSKTLFSPHGTATRGMMATILWRMEGSPAPKGKNSFTDVEAGKWYADAITWTAENGIFAGYGKDKFGPDDPITREQLAAIFYRYADYKGYDLTVKGNLDKFKDADKITDYAETAMGWAVGSGLMKGKSGNLLDPQGTATRAEIAAMLHRFIEKYELVQGKAPGGLMGWIDPKRLQIPKTGDSSVLGLWGISLCTSLAGCLVLTTWQIRRRREEESLQIIEK